jgi:glycosyltransferase involved in cell wall biosynthesis
VKDLSKLKVAIVHDWLVGGGAERVVEQLHKTFPDAPIYTSYASKEWQKKLDGKVVTGFLQHWPFSVLRKFIPVLRIWWFTHLDFSDYDLVISSSGNGEAKGIRVPKGVTHVCYCHTPTHFYWRHYNQYMKSPGFGLLNPLARLGLKLLVGPLRKWDLKASKRPHYYMANSNHIKRDIQRYYGRDAVVIHPPVDTERFKNNTHKREGFVTIGRQTPYKKTDVVVQACSDLGLPLTVVGRGPEHNKLVAMANDNITFDADANDDAVNTYMSRAEAFIFASFEDFGITPVEAMAAGTPVLAYEAGGALDYVVPGKTGAFFDEQTAASLEKVLTSFDASKFDHAEIAQSAQKFSVANFQKNLKEFLELIVNKEMS